MSRRPASNAPAVAMAPSDRDEERRPRLARVYREHVAFVYRSAQRLGAPEHVLEDLVQDVFLVVARRIDDFEGRSDLRTWLFAITQRVLRQHRRSLWRHLRRTEALADRNAIGPQHANDHDAREAERLLLRLLDELDEDRRAVFVLSELEDMTAPEIAQALEVNINTVYTRLRAARKRVTMAARRLGLTQEGLP